MALHLKFQKCLILMLMLGGDLGHSPASIDAYLPPAPPQCDQANVLFAPASFCLLDYRHPYSAITTILAALVTILAGLMLPILGCAVTKLGGQFKSTLEYVRVNSPHWINIVCASSLTLRLVYILAIDLHTMASPKFVSGVNVGTEETGLSKYCHHHSMSIWSACRHV